MFLNILTRIKSNKSRTPSISQASSNEPVKKKVDKVYTCVPL